MKLLFISLTFWFSISSHAQDAYLLPEGPLYPNGIAQDSDGTLYVGFVQGGQIFCWNRDKWEIFYHDEDQIYSATSLRYDSARNWLWGTSPDFITKKRNSRVFAINLKTKHIERLIDFPEGSFANDIALGKDGNVYITDTFKPQIFVYDVRNDAFEPFVKDDILATEESYGLAGITLTPRGALYVGLHGAGKIFEIKDGLKPKEILLERKLENPDGIQAIGENKLLVLEEASESGNGRVTEVTLENGRGTIRVLKEGLQSPVNLTVSKDFIYVTEARIRNILRPDLALPTPDLFWVRKLRR